MSVSVYRIEVLIAVIIPEFILSFYLQVSEIKSAVITILRDSTAHNISDTRLN